MMCPVPSRGRGPASAAFTLVELLVAVAVLALLTLMVAEIFNNASAIISQGYESTGSLDAGESVLAQVNLDISRMVLRDDVDYNFTKVANTSDSFSFYARTSGLNTSGTASSSNPRPLCVVSYQVGTDPGNATSTALQLNYSALQIDWSSNPTSGATAFTLSQLVPASTGTQTQYLTGGTLPQPSASNYTTLAREVIRLEYCFVLKADPNNGNPAKLLTAEVPGNTTGVAPIENVAGIMVGIVVVDPQSRLLFPTGADVTLAAKFKDAVDNQDLLSLWSPTLSPATLQAAGIPTSTISGIHIYQKYIPFPW